MTLVCLFSKQFSRCAHALTFGLRYTPNPSTLMTFFHKKMLMKNCWHVLKNFMITLKLSLNTFWNFSEHITHWKNFHILIYKTLKILYLGKSAIFTNFPKSSNRELISNSWLRWRFFDWRANFSLYRSYGHESDIYGKPLSRRTF